MCMFLCKHISYISESHLWGKGEYKVDSQDTEGEVHAEIE